MISGKGYYKKPKQMDLSNKPWLDYFLVVNVETFLHFYRYIEVRWNKNNNNKLLTSKL